jgi:hypothetical protein
MKGSPNLIPQWSRSDVGVRQLAAALSEFQAWLTPEFVGLSKTTDAIGTIRSKTGSKLPHYKL